MKRKANRSRGILQKSEEHKKHNTKKATSFFLFVMLIFSMAVAAEEIGVISLTLVPNSYDTARVEGYDEITMEEFDTRGLPGAPKLPQKNYDIQLPPDADLESVQLEILSRSTQEITGEYEIAPDSFPAEGSGEIFYGDTIVKNGKNVEIYEKNEFYPSVPVEILRTYQLRDIKVLRIQFTPLQYNPVSKKLQLDEEVNIRVSWKKRTPATKATPPVSWSGYAIITTNAIVSGSSNLTNFITHLQNIGYTVYTVTETQYGTATGQQRTINIRNWLAANYVSYQIQYVLLIGNPDPDDPSMSDAFGGVPMMMCWPNTYSTAPSHTNYPTPTDYFYADLTGNWDSDGDGYYGENEHDNVDFGPEVYVGRIPVYGSDYAALDNILTRFINYNGANSSIMLPMAISNYENEHNSENSCNNGWERTDGLNLPQLVITNIANPNGYSHYVMYERSGLAGRGHDPVPTTAFGYDAPITNANVTSQWANDYGIVFWWAHGGPTSASRKYWGDAADDGDNIVEDGSCGSAGNELSWWNFLSSSDTSTLTDANTFTFQASCNNGWPENSNNLGYALLKRGAICTVSSSRVSWYDIGPWGSAEANRTNNAAIGYAYVDHLVNSGETAGKALYDGKNSLTICWSWQGWMNLFDFNLYGDPSLTLEAPVKPASLVSSISANPSQVSSGQQITVVMSVQNSGGAQANNVTPIPLTVNATGTASATFLSGPNPASTNIPAGSSQNFIWTYIANSGLNGGKISFKGNATGTDANSGNPVSSAITTSNTVTVQVPASINANLTINLSIVSGGQNIKVNMIVSNTGQATASNVTPSALAVSTIGTASATYDNGPTPGSASILGGSSQMFEWIYICNSGANGGTVTFSGNATGSDANSGNLITSNTASATVTVQTPARLVSLIEATPTVVKPGEMITVTMTVQNTGQAGAVNVIPSALTATGTGTVTPTSGPIPVSTNIPGLSSQVFTWTFKATALGTVTLSGNAMGTDTNSGAVVTSPLTTSNTVIIRNPNPTPTASSNVNQQMRPVSQTHIRQAEEHMLVIQHLLNEVRGQGKDTAEAENLLEQAKEALEKAYMYFAGSNYIAASYWAMQAIRLLEECKSYLESL